MVFLSIADKIENLKDLIPTGNRHIFAFMSSQRSFLVPVSNEKKEPPQKTEFSFLERNYCFIA